MGRGGPEHKYLQQLIKQWGDGMGFRSTIEKGILEGTGSVDVALEKPGLAIACLISITTPDEWELGSVRKCLKAGYGLVVMTSSDLKHLGKLRKRIEPTLAPSEQPRVRFLSPDEFFVHVQGLLIRAAEQEQTLRGYKVKATFKPVANTDADDRRQTISQVVARAVKRMKDKK
jgi:hypothetical protein